MPAIYAWPTTLYHPPRPPRLVYLDLLHWIALAKAFGGHRAGEPHKDALAACIDAVDRGAVTFPISDSIYIEMSKIGQHRQRRDLREVIERVSGFMVVTSRAVTAAHEIETSPMISAIGSVTLLLSRSGFANVTRSSHQKCASTR